MLSQLVDAMLFTSFLVKIGANYSDRHRENHDTANVNGAKHMGLLRFEGSTHPDTIAIIAMNCPIPVIGNMSP